MDEWKLASWNVNGIRAVLKKGFLESFEDMSPDVLGIQETKIQDPQIPDPVRRPQGYDSVWHSAERKGYSGTAVFYRRPPQRIGVEFAAAILGDEGRMIEVDFGRFVFFNIYFPNGQMSEERLKYKLEFYDRSLSHFQTLAATGRSLVISGDFNTAHKPIDLKNPKSNEDRSGFLPVEREWMDRFVAAGFVDTFRLLNQEPDRYSWWTYRFRAREKNIGWRIDYFFVSSDLVPNVAGADILDRVMGSDHCPVTLTLRF